MWVIIVWSTGQFLNDYGKPRLCTKPSIHVYDCRGVDAFDGDFCRHPYFIHHIFPCGTLTAVWYRDGILPQFGLVFLASMYPDFVFMEDYMRIHRGYTVGQYLGSETILRMKWSF